MTQKALSDAESQRFVLQRFVLEETLSISGGHESVDNQTTTKA